MGHSCQVGQESVDTNEGGKKGYVAVCVCVCVCMCAYSSFLKVMCQGPGTVTHPIPSFPCHSVTLSLCHSVTLSSLNLLAATAYTLIVFLFMGLTLLTPLTRPVNLFTWFFLSCSCWSRQIKPTRAIFNARFLFFFFSSLFSQMKSVS